MILYRGKLSSERVTDDIGIPRRWRWHGSEWPSLDWRTHAANAAWVFSTLIDFLGYFGSIGNSSYLCNRKSEHSHHQRGNWIIWGDLLRISPPFSVIFGYFSVVFLAFWQFAATLSVAATARERLYLLWFQKMCGSVAAIFQKLKYLERYQLLLLILLIATINSRNCYY